MTPLLARDLLTNRIVFADSEQHPSEVKAQIEENRATLAAVFESGRFLGLANLGSPSVLQFPSRIFADLISVPAAEAILESLPAAELQCLDWDSTEAVPVVTLAGDFVGAITQSSLLEGLWNEQKHARQRMQQLHGDLRLAIRRSAIWETTSAFAHEVHQPLGAISNYAQGTKRGLEQGRISQDRVLEALGEIIDLCEAASQVVGRVRAIQANRRPEAAAVSLLEVIRNALELLEPTFAQAAVTLQFRPPMEPIVVWGDALLLTHAVFHVLLNAAEVRAPHPEVGRQVSVRLKPQLGCWELWIEDNGPGLTSEHTDQFFDPFVTTKPGHDGLGLSLCRNILTHYGGSIRLENLVPHGCRACLTFLMPPE